MNDRYDQLEALGFNDWFKDQVDEHTFARRDIARVISVHRDRYLVSQGGSAIFAQLLGTLRYTAASALDLPTTGDWVYVDLFDDAQAIIHGVIPRKSLLQRKTAGKSIEFQLIAANIDVAFIMQSVDANLNLRRLERYLVMVNESDITPVILLSKCDLKSADHIAEIERSIVQAVPQAAVMTLSNLKSEDIDRVKDCLKPGWTYCLLGSSGVGKTTLLNNILGVDRFETQEISEKNKKGRHTTTSRELVQLENGALLIDTPGMRELGTMSADTGLDETFPEISEFARQCRFSDCSHSGEAGCAVATAIEEGKLAENRFKNFLKMRKEAEFNEMSYVEKRKKDKDFGKMVKAAMKLKRRP